VLFLIGGLAFVYTGGKDLYAAVAVAFAAALYMVEASVYLSLIQPLTGIEQQYTKLLLISVAVLAIGCGAFALGRRLLILEQRKPMFSC